VNEQVRTLAGLHGQRAALTLLYQLSGYVPAAQRRLLCAWAQSILLYEIDRLLMELQTTGGTKCILCRG
jgi:hypothetical protein